MDKDKPHLRYEQQELWVINCGCCKRWWSIETTDLEDDSKYAITCTWCGTRNQTVRNN